MACETRIPIVSPVNGLVEDVKKRYKQMGIFIRPGDNHDIFAPMSGTITRVFWKEGNFERNTFYATEHHTGRLFVEIDHAIAFMVEVGKPQYITDTVQLYVKEEQEVRIGAKIGEIIIGSYAELYFLQGIFTPIKNRWQEHVELTGGETILAYRCFSSDPSPSSLEYPS